MSGKNKPLSEWKEKDYIEAHIELWTKIKFIWKYVPGDLIHLKHELIVEMVGNSEIKNDCFLCDFYQKENNCNGCPLKTDSEIFCNPAYYHLAYNGYDEECIDEIINLGIQRWDKLSL